MADPEEMGSRERIAALQAQRARIMIIVEQFLPEVREVLTRLGMVLPQTKEVGEATRTFLQEFTLLFSEKEDAECRIALLELFKALHAALKEGHFKRDLELDESRFSMSKSLIDNLRRAFEHPALQVFHPRPKITFYV